MGKGHSRGGHQGSVKPRFCCAESQEDKTLPTYGNADNRRRRNWHRA